MAELKHTFVSGRMDKDRDERLVENGSYRDALNIHVSSSEGSDVGAVENLLGNKKISALGIETEKKISEIESKFGIEDFFQITSREEVNRLQAEKGRLSQQLSGHLKQWEISSKNLENAKEQFDL